MVLALDGDNELILFFNDVLSTCFIKGKLEFYKPSCAGWRLANAQDDDQITKADYTRK